VQTIANDPVMDLFAKLDLKTVALLLDVDGTIIDIGPSPTEVHVSVALLASLERLLVLTGGAVALVSGRPIADLDRLFSPLRLPVIGGHGAEMRLDTNEVFYWAKPLSQDLRQRLADTASIGPEKCHSRQSVSAVMSLQAERRFPAKRQNCYWAKECSKLSVRVSARGTAFVS
jgi:HAD superfamily hydrolase (TIGR01484 family)